MGRRPSSVKMCAPLSKACSKLVVTCGESGCRAPVDIALCSGKKPSSHFDNEKGKEMKI